MTTDLGLCFHKDVYLHINVLKSNLYFVDNLSAAFNTTVNSRYLKVDGTIF